jgi:hypothetical protein
MRLNGELIQNWTYVTAAFVPFKFFLQLFFWINAGPRREKAYENVQWFLYCGDAVSVEGQVLSGSFEKHWWSAYFSGRLSTSTEWLPGLPGNSWLLSETELFYSSWPNYCLNCSRFFRRGLGAAKLPRKMQQLVFNFQFLYQSNNMFWYDSQTFGSHNIFRQELDLDLFSSYLEKSKCHSVSLFRWVI